MTLLCGITRLSSELGLRVTVEGIENRKQLELVNDEVFVHEGQGFLFSKPLPCSEIPDFLRSFSVEEYDGSKKPLAEAASEKRRPCKATTKGGDPVPTLELDTV